MDDERYTGWNGRMMFGVLLLLFGALLLLNNTNIIDMGPIRSLWPLILVGLGISTFVNAHDREQSGVGVWRRKTRRAYSGGGTWLIILGLWLLVSTNHLFGLRFRDAWPILIIGWGTSMVWRSLNRASRRHIAEESHGT